MAAPATRLQSHEDASLCHLLARVQILGTRVATAVTLRRALSRNDEEEFRGLYVSDDEVDALLEGDWAPMSDDADDVDRLLAEVEAEADRMEDDGHVLRLRRLARDFDLDERDLNVLLVALAPEIEPGFERLFCYLHDDVTRRRAGPSVALELACGTNGPLTERWRLSPAGPLMTRRLVTFDDVDRPFLTRSLVVPDRVVSHLLGDDSQDPGVAAVAIARAVTPVRPGAELERAVMAHSGLIYVRDGVDEWGADLVARAFDAASLTPLVIDLTRVAPNDDSAEIIEALLLEAGLMRGALVAGPVEVLERHPALLRSLADAPLRVALVGRRSWDARWSTRPPLVVDSPRPTPTQSGVAWRAALDGRVPADLAPGAATAQFRLAPGRIEAAARTAALRAEVSARPVSVEDLHYGARLQSSSGLERLAKRLEPRASWSDLVVTATVEGSLRDLAARARHCNRVLVEWQMGARSSKGRGVIALFTGPSGTGKTMSAEVLAGDLGLDLYVIDLASIVDKYIGETEKNLDAVFAEAGRVNGVLLFDEADALFGKRSGVQDAHDRYANIEVAYLLQRMEAFDGVAILTSNLRGNLDDAFARRLDAVVELPLPDEPARVRLWRAHLPSPVPQSQDVDFSFLSRFKLSGGNVRNACLAAAFRAAAEDREVRMEDLVRAVAKEYAKLGHMCVESEFGKYHELVARA